MDGDVAAWHAIEEINVSCMAVTALPSLLKHLKPHSLTKLCPSATCVVCKTSLQPAHAKVAIMRTQRYENARQGRGLSGGGHFCEWHPGMISTHEKRTDVLCFAATGALSLMHRVPIPVVSHPACGACREAETCRATC